METLKVVIIGECGVGKTSLRNQYTTSRFNPSYRATVGLDFHSTTLTLPPHPACILQLWDTAGQDRFAPLSRAFFRGADAVLLVFDCTKPASLKALRKWWGEFKSVEGVEGVVVVCVGNKTDLRREGEGVGTEMASKFLAEIMPERCTEARRGRTRRRNAPPSGPKPSLGSSLLGALPSLLPQLPVPPPQPSPLPSPPRHPRKNSSPIPAPTFSPTHALMRGRSSSQTRPLVGTMTSIATHPTIYHTPSSSLFDRLDAELAGRVGTPTPPVTPPRRNRLASSGSQESALSDRTVTPPRPSASEPLTPATEVGTEQAGEADEQEEEEEEMEEPALFFTSSMDRSSVVPVFEYVARKALRLREEDERRRGTGGETGHGQVEARDRRGGNRKKGWVVLGERRGKESRCCA